MSARVAVGVARKLVLIVCLAYCIATNIVTIAGFSVMSAGVVVASVSYKDMSAGNFILIFMENVGSVDLVYAIASF